MIYDTYDLYNKQCEFGCLVGKTLVSIQNEENEQVSFRTEDGEVFLLYHSQGCCESVSIEDISGDLDDLVGVPILLAEGVSNTEPDEELKTKRAAERAAVEAEGGYYYARESETWTFYKLSTIKGSVTIRWYGTSNGYYSERVDFAQVK